jgi:outer membrane protein assembly factor BamB
MVGFPARRLLPLVASWSCRVAAAAGLSLASAQARDEADTPAGNAPGAIAPAWNLSFGLGVPTETFGERRPWPLGPTPGASETCPYATLCDDVLVLREGGFLRAVDTWMWVELWTSPEFGSPPPAAGARAPDVSGGDRSGALPGVAPGHSPTAILSRLTAGSGAVFSVEGREEEEVARGSPAARPQRFTQLVARDVTTGRVLWQMGGRRSPVPADFILATPLAHEQRVLTVVHGGGDTRMVLLDARTGELVRATALSADLVGNDPEANIYWLCGDSERVYVGRDRGGAAAHRIVDLQPVWVANPLGAGPFPRDGAGPWDAGEPVLAGRSLVLATTGGELLALDRASGRVNWRSSRSPEDRLIGAIDATLLLLGERLSCLDARDGQSVRWRSLPISTTGLPALCGGRVCVPMPKGILVFDANTGKQVDGSRRGDPPTPDGAQQPGTDAARSDGLEFTSPGDECSTLVLSPHVLISAGPRGLRAYTNSTTLRRRAAKRLSEDPGDARAALAMAWADAADGQLVEAQARLRARRPSPGEVQRARDRLLVQVNWALAGRGDASSRKPCLSEAFVLAEHAPLRGAIACELGGELEARGEVQPALAHYEALLRDLSPRGQIPVGRGALQASLWLHAQQRMDSLLHRLPAEERTRFIERAAADLCAGPDGAVALARLRPLARGGASQAELDRALVAGLAPELALPRLDPDGAGPPALLARWRVHASLGMLEEARADRDAWHAYVATAVPGQPLDHAARQDVEHAEAALRKLERSRAAPITHALRPLWTLDRAQLVLDGTDAARAAEQEPEHGHAARATLLVRNLDSAALELHHAGTGVLLRRFDSIGEASPAEGSRSAWPAKRHGPLAVVPSPAGLTCVGLGPELLGGGRIWSRVVAWGRPLDDFSACSAAGPEGVTISPLPGWIVQADWHDGALRWQRELPEERVERIVRAGQRLIVLTAAGRLLSFDAPSGADERSVSPPGARWIGAAVVGDSLVAWTNARLVGLDPATLTTRWSRAAAGLTGLVGIPSARWIAFPSPGESGWAVLRAGDGDVVLKGAVAGLREVTAWHVQGDVSFVAGLASSEAGPAVMIVALDSAGREGWRCVIEGAHAVLPDALSAHDAWIPVLVERAADERDSVGARVAIQLVEKSAGGLLAPVMVGPSPAGDRASVRLWAGSSRLLVQVGERLAAFGSPVAGGP